MRQMKQKVFGTIYKSTVSLMAASAMSLSLQANEAAANAVQGDDEILFELEEVVITATKSGESSIQNTAIAIDTLSSRDLEETLLTDIRDLSSLVPGLSITENTGFGQIFIRGIGTNSVFAGSDPSSTLHVDGVYIGQSGALFTNFIDVERIEVLKGPQGTLYGRNSVGGNINVISRAPTFAPHYEVQATYGNHDQRRVEGYISGGLTKSVAANLSVYGSWRDGFFDNATPGAEVTELGDENVKGAKAQFLFDSGNKFQATVRADYMKLKTHDVSYSKPLIPNNNVGSALVDSLFNDYEAVAIDAPNYSEKEIYGASLEANYQFTEQLSIKSISAYRETKADVFIDADMTDLPLVQTNVAMKAEQFSQEYNLIGNYDKFKFILGAFYFDEKTDQQSDIGVLVSGVNIKTHPVVDVKSIAAFGQLSYKLTDKLSLIGGLRYTDEEKTLNQRANTTLLANGVVIAGPFAFTDRIDNNAWTPKFGLEYQAQENIFVYAHASRGYKSGGYLNSVLTPDTNFAPEFLWAYEGGIKTDLYDDRLRLNLSGYYYDYKDLQVLSFLGGGIANITNAATATIKGVELQGSATPMKGLVFDFAMAYTDATYDRYENAVGVGGTVFDASGNFLNNTPEWSGNIGGRYAFDITDSIQGFVRADYNWQSRVFFTAANDSIETQDSYGLMNASFGIEHLDQGWKLSVWGRNLFDHEYIVGSANFPAAGPSGRIGNPLTFGVKLGFKY